MNDFTIKQKYEHSTTERQGVLLLATLFWVLYVEKSIALGIVEVT